MKVLFVVSESVPFAKSGGLGDVAGALPKEIIKLGTDIRVMMPKYGIISEHVRSQMSKVVEYEVQVGWRKQYCGIEVCNHEGVLYYFVDNIYYFNRDSMYGHYDDGERFAFFTRAVLESFPHLDFYPDLVHCHDWHTAMVPFLLRTEYIHKPNYHFIKSLFTIHNLHFQGIFPKQVLSELLMVPQWFYTHEHLEFYGNMNFMKGALLASDYITTVSPTYRNEIMHPYFGEKLEGVLSTRKSDIVGILNGIDEDVYNPAIDENIHPYSPSKLAGKTENKRKLQEELGLEVNLERPIISMVTRLTKQKGLELIQHVLEELLWTEDFQFVLLGTGEYEFENFFRHVSYKYGNRVSATIGFDEAFAHRIYAGSDIFLMPSKFEPCGLGQMIAMKYGTVPVVRETGGLNDTVFSYDELTGDGNGFTFKNFNAHDMMHTVKRALAYYPQKEVWDKLIYRGMVKDFSWAQSAYRYNQLYEELRSRSETHVF
ncbi:glycogen synthase [Bacillus coahuilensis m2-6]|uniref:glycogen synthase GlgA n=1 Tax=Bacillus coahuilensis TaxID=408580 RepID=UPI0007500FC1|nr:glycogen synthase GlgA [Bacillus coahuilensis]KUP06356.1 glycogen synthase [Bacillus coahuilensis m2-6]